MFTVLKLWEGTNYKSWKWRMVFYHATITNPDNWSILISGKCYPSMRALVTENISTISAVMLGQKKEKDKFSKQTRKNIMKDFKIKRLQVQLRKSLY